MIMLANYNMMGGNQFNMEEFNLGSGMYMVDVFSSQYGFPSKGGSQMKV